MSAARSRISSRSTTGQGHLAKAPSTPPISPVGVMDGLALSRRNRARPAALLEETERIVHGTTAATNALLERKGARVGLLTTDGHRDIIEMREGFKDDRYNLRMAPPVPLVPRARRLGVRERIRCGRPRGDAARRRVARRAVRSSAPRGRGGGHLLPARLRERAPRAQTAAALARAMPDAYVSVSSEVLPQIKEYERVCTTVVNAYVGPILVELPVAPQRSTARRRLSRASSDHAVARRRRVDRGGASPRRRRGAIGSRGRCCRRPRTPPGSWAKAI